MAGKFLLTPEMVAQIEHAVRLGGTHRVAARGAGIGESTLSRYVARGFELIEAEADPTGDDALCVDLARRLGAAEYDRALESLDILRRAQTDRSLSKTWRAAAWYLERRYPQDYGRQVQEIQGAGGAPVRVELTWEE